MFQKLEAVERRYEELNKLISDPEVIARQNEWKNLMKEHSDMVNIVEKYREYKKVKEVSVPRCGTLDNGSYNAYNLYYQYSVSLILENGNGDVINKKNINVSFRGDRFYDDYERVFMEVEVKSQKKYFEENVAVFKEEIGYKGVSVIIPRRECIVALNKRLKAAKKNK